MLAAGAATDSRTLALLRHGLMFLLVAGLFITGTDLILLEHYEDPSQLIPLALIAVAILVVAWQFVAPSRGSVRTLQAVMVALLLSGALGVAMHYQGNLEFQLEMNADQSNWELFWKVIHAKAPPAIAPTAMAHLGLLGLAWAFRHPLLNSLPAGTPATQSEV